MARLVLQTAEGQQIVELRDTNSLGRHPSNTIQLLDKIVSKEHCIIERRGPMFWLRDLGSLNGTFINRERVQGEKELKHGDEIALGQTKARYEEAPQSVYPPPPTSQSTGWQQQVPQMGSQLPQIGGQAQWPPSSGTPAVGGAAQPAYVRQPPPVSHVPPTNAYAQQQGPHSAGYPQPPRPPPPRGQQVPGQQVPQQVAAQSRRPPPPAMRTPSRGFSTAYLPAISQSTHVDTSDDEARQIGAEIVATERDFRSFEEIAGNMLQLRADYERLRFSYLLTRDIADEKDPTTLYEKILKSIFNFIPAQRGVIFINFDGQMQPTAEYRTDGGKGAISVSNTILNKVIEDRKAVLTHDAAMDFAASKGKSMILNQIQSAIVAPMLHKEELLGVLWLDSKSLAQFQPKDLELVSAVANQAAMFIEINMLSQQKDRLSRLVSPDVFDRIVREGVDIQPGGSRTQCTVFNSDIRGFTRMSEHTAPEEIVEMLNAYFEQMVDTIFKFEGTLDKFMGDGIMALWGAPVGHADDPERAVACALEQVEVLGHFNRSRMSMDKPTLGVGFGIHTGPVVAGYIGSSKALSYTVIGDVANTSARLCSKALAGQIIVSEGTREHLGPKFELEELAPTRIRGKDKPLRIYNVVRTRPMSQVPMSARTEAGQPNRDPASRVADHPTDPSDHHPRPGA
jgi:adenylate cyclase